MATSTSGWNRHGLKSSGSPVTPSHAYLYYLTGVTFQSQVFNDIESHNLSSCLAIKIDLYTNTITKTNISTNIKTTTSTKEKVSSSAKITKNDWPFSHYSILSQFTGTSTRAWVWWRLTNLGARSLLLSSTHSGRCQQINYNMNKHIFEAFLWRLTRLD